MLINKKQKIPGVDNGKAHGKLRQWRHRGWQNSNAHEEAKLNLGVQADSKDRTTQFYGQKQRITYS